MGKKVYHVNKGKVQKPTNIIPIGTTNTITDNMTTDTGNVLNVSETNAGYAKRWVDENHL